MKSMILAAAFMLAAFTQTFAADVAVKPTVLRSFQTSFNGASDIQWSIIENVYRADFVVDGEKTIAFFNMEDGALIATSRYITIKELPGVLRSSLKAQTAEATITEIFEVQSNGSIDYYVTVRDGAKSTILKSAITKWSVFKK